MLTIKRSVGQSVTIIAPDGQRLRVQLLTARGVDGGQGTALIGFQGPRAFTVLREELVEGDTGLGGPAEMREANAGDEAERRALARNQRTRRF